MVSVAVPARDHSSLDRIRALIRRRRSLGLRARIVIVFTLGTLVLATLLAGATYGLTRESLLNQRERAATAQAVTNTELLFPQLDQLDTPRLQERLESLPNVAGSRPLLMMGDEVRSDVAETTGESIPDKLRAVVLAGTPAQMRYDLAGEPQLAVGIPYPGRPGVAYFELVPLLELQNTLSSLGWTLLGAGVVTTLAGAALGSWASRRVLRPLADVSNAAEAIAGGRLDTRLEGVEDADLAQIATSFNAMAEALEARIEKDARFASDVSHELRSPLMTLSASIEVMESRADEIPERARQALELLSADVARFQELVAALLEISRFDAGAAHLSVEEVNLADLVFHAVHSSIDPDVPIDVPDELLEKVIFADKRRLEQVIANLVDNAVKYGGGASRVLLETGPEGRLWIVVEDEGPGVPEEERDRVFERFARGSTAGRRGAGSGSGLGLALVAEHIRLHHGRVWVEDRPDGLSGARFVVELSEGDDLE